MRLPTQIRTQRLLLVAIEVSHSQAVYDLFDANRERLTEAMWGVDAVQHVDDYAERIGRMVERCAEGTAFGFCIFELDDGEVGDLAGTMGVHSVDAQHQRGELGYWLGARFEGRGFVSEAIRAVEAACWEAGFHRIEIRCSANNARSRAVPLRLGYQLDARTREAWRHHDRFIDGLVFSKIRGE